MEALRPAEWPIALQAVQPKHRKYLGLIMSSKMPAVRQVEELIQGQEIHRPQWLGFWGKIVGKHQRVEQPGL